MKKFIARILAAAMLLGLLTVSAVAADTYGPYSITDYMGTVYSFTAAKVETRDIAIGIEEDVETVKATVITVQPGSSLNVKDKEGEDGARFTAYSKTESGYQPLDGTFIEFGSGVLDGAFGKNPNWSVPVDMLSITTSYDSATYDIEEAFILLGESGTGTATSPTAPATPTAPAGDTAFTDVAAGAFYYDAVKWAVEKGVTAGTTATTFSPNETCTTAQIITFLWRANGSPEPTIANPFTDVAESNFYYKAALWAHEKGMVSGDAFGGSTPCTRSQTVTYLWTMEGKASTEPSTAFQDVDSKAPYAQAVAWAVDLGITSGTTENTFSPEDTCTRGQIVTFLYRWDNIPEGLGG